MKKLLLTVTAALALAPAAEGAEYLHPNLKSKSVHITTVAVMPAQIEMQKSGVKGGESMIKESEAIASAVGALVSKLFTSRGATVLEDPVIVPAHGAADERRTAIASLQGRFDALAPQIMKKPKDVTKGRYSLGDEVAGVVSRKADVVVFIRGTGIMQTKGKKFLSGGLLGLALAPNGTLLCDVIVVDARSGDVLFLARMRGAGNIVKDAGGQVEKPLSKSLKKLLISG